MAYYLSFVKDPISTGTIYLFIYVYFLYIIWGEGAPNHIWNDIIPFHLNEYQSMQVSTLLMDDLGMNMCEILINLYFVTLLCETNPS